MNPLDWLASKFPDAPLNHMRAVKADEQGVRCVRVSGTSHSIAWSDIVRVSIVTTDRGPFDDDVFFVLVTATETFLIPQPAAGTDELLTELQKLPGFDNEAVISAMSCTDNKEFVCWERPESEIK